jgi:addiction module RelE/StbE family toxin
MIVVWTPEARTDRRAIFLTIRQDNPRAAVAMDELFEAAAERLETTPRMGRPGLIEGTRELIPHESYRLIYEIKDEIISVLAIVHTRRQWPPSD